jgi:REP element-mobilizing transposase RayT
MDRKQNVFGTSKIAPNKKLARADAAQLKHPPFKLTAKCRGVVEKAVREVCVHRNYTLRALNARTNHVHSVVTAAKKPEPILIAFQAYSTRKLRKKGLAPPGVKPWARHGSTIYLWKDRDVAKAIEYVLYGQGDELFRLDDD